jgi:hypothetical protein
MSTKIVVPEPFRKAIQAQLRQSREMLVALDDGDSAIARETADLSKAMANVAASWPANVEIPAAPPQGPVAEPPPPTLPPPNPTPAPTPTPIPSPTPAPADPRLVIGEQRPAGGTAFYLDDRIIDSQDFGIRANAGHVPVVSLNDVLIKSKQYGIWADSIGDLRLADVEIEIGGGTDPYCVRVITDTLVWSQVLMTNNDGKAVARITGVKQGLIRNLGTKGGQVWLGGGAGVANDAAAFQGFENVMVEDWQHFFDNPDAAGTPSVNSALEFYSVRDCSFTDVIVILPKGLGKKVLTVWEGYCANIRLNNWLVAEWEKSGSGVMVSAGEPLDWKHIHNADKVRTSGVLSIGP